ncbi:RING finger and CHY zinc finger domain-containing protein 1 [Anoplophora glabripennis]|uniref:RING finger and CHY zinc finger domain-containing protein 1 n=1 Tax=Anoplophora glabripennis TaxID=217634 RepID=UPI000875117B|nr:RING finger and CHY zinc finger domain-containing protein 1 [Anoplophora glabripennis]
MDIATPGAEGPQDDTLKYGCPHYRRKCKFVSPCCNKIYTCRFCHDEQEDHKLIRKAINELMCALCDTRQPVQANCQSCGILFGKYSCLECNLFDDEDKNQFHCAGCEICRVGGADRFFHCDTCNICLPLQLKNNGHKCVENVSRANCPVCLEDIHTSRIPCHIPLCGHLLHRTCFEQLVRSNHFSCPICQKSLMNMDQIWKLRDTEMANTPMPPEYSNYFMEIQCKDCHKKGVVKFHIVGLKCTHCGSYNTYKLKGPLIIEGLEGNAENTNLNENSGERSN